MPILVWFHIAEDSSRFLGVCDYADSTEFLKKLAGLCNVMGWDAKYLRSELVYLGSIADRFPVI